MTSGRNQENKAYLDDNLAAALSYILGFVSGFIILAVKRDSFFAQFHAIQSILFSLFYLIIKYLISTFIYPLFITANPSTYDALSLINTSINIIFLVLWILLMILAFTGKIWKLPFIGYLSEKIAKKER